MVAWAKPSRATTPTADRHLVAREFRTPAPEAAVEVTPLVLVSRRRSPVIDTWPPPMERNWLVSKLSDPVPAMLTGPGP